MIEGTDYVILFVIEVTATPPHRRATVGLSQAKSKTPLCVFFIKHNFDSVRLNAQYSEVPEAVGEIIDAHLLRGSDLLLCQEELIDAGYAEWARI